MLSRRSPLPKSECGRIGGPSPIWQLCPNICRVKMWWIFVIFVVLLFLSVRVGFWQSGFFADLNENKREEKIIKKTGQSMLHVSCCTFVLLLINKPAYLLALAWWHAPCSHWNQGQTCAPREQQWTTARENLCGNSLRIVFWKSLRSFVYRVWELSSRKSAGD